MDHYRSGIALNAGREDMSFEEFGFSQPLIDAVERRGFEDPTPIQIEAIPEALDGRDILGCAQTGTGKTVAFLLPAIEHLRNEQGKHRWPRLVVMAPTRELVLQIADEARDFATGSKLSVCAVFGGGSIRKQADQLKRGADMVVATPGRLMDHMRRNNIRFDELQILVIDEADRMLDMGFLPDMRQIIDHMPAVRQTMMFSATMPPTVAGLANEFLRDPIRIDIKVATPPESIDQRLYPVPKHLKIDLLVDLIQSQTVESMLVFTATKVNADMLYRKLKEAKISAACIHGDYRQKDRLAALRRFKAGEVKVLVATNVASRGLDIEDISHVANFDVPEHAEDYVHRIGRTARAEADGNAITLVTPEDERAVAKIQTFLGRKIPRIRLEDFDYDIPAPSWAKPSFEALLKKAQGDDDEVEHWRSLARFG
jgi:ATP-dependent RNA helicase RhlE